MWNLISTLMTAGWLKKMDSDGTSYSATGVQVTGGGSGTNGLGNNSAWVRLQAPAVNGGAVVDQTRELTIQRGTSDLLWRIKYSASALFTGGSPAATVTPSSADEVFMTGGGSDASPTYYSWFATNNTYRWHIICGGATEFYSFVAFAHSAGTNTSLNAIALDIMTAGSFPITDVDPAVMYCSAATGGIADITAASFPTANSTNPALARAWLGATSSAGASTTGTNSINVVTSRFGSSGGFGGGAIFHSNPWTGKSDLLPVFWGSKYTAGPKGLKGYSTLFKISTVGTDYLATYSTVSSRSRDMIYFGHLVLPWSGAQPIT